MAIHEIFKRSMDRYGVRGKDLAITAGVSAQHVTDFRQGRKWVSESTLEALLRGLVLGGVFLTMYDKRRALNRDVSKEITEALKDKVLECKISDNIALAEAPALGQDIFRYNPRSKGAKDYLSLAEEIHNLKH